MLTAMFANWWDKVFAVMVFFKKNRLFHPVAKIWQHWVSERHE